ncbi:MAG TPA: hypothetical protein VN200_05215 [Rhodoglobus sp.]|nr:hypothetical protein [Rhodoglobus sp.]
MKRTAAVVALAVAFGLSGCTPQEPTVVTFEVAGEQTYRIELTSREHIDHVRALMDGSTEEGRIPVGRIVRDDPGVNEPWSWHIDPATLEFADFTTEVCDGLPEYVEDRTLTSDTYCPWIAEPIELTGPGSR